MDRSDPILLGWKLHVDAVGSHPKIFFLNLALFSIEGLDIFHDKWPIGTVLPKFTGIGSDTHSGAYIKNALWELIQYSKYEFILPSFHRARISTNPVILNADRAVLPMITGGPAPSQQGAALFDVKYKKKSIECFCRFLVRL